MSISERTRRMLSTGESTTTEFKSKLTDKLVEVLVAFANNRGGTVLLGVENDKDHSGRHIGKIIGIDATDANKQKIQSAADSTHDKIDIAIDYETDEAGHGIYVITVIEGRNKPYCTPDGRYITRRDGQNCLITPTMLRDFYQAPEESPVLAVEWADENNNKIDALIVAPIDPKEAREAMILQLRNLLPTNEQLALVKKYEAEIRYDLSSDPGEHTSNTTGIKSITQSDCLCELQEYCSKTEEVCALLEKEFAQIQWVKMLSRRRIKPRFILHNSGPVPAIDPVAFVYPVDTLRFFEENGKHNLTGIFPPNRPALIERILDLAAAKEKRDRLGPMGDIEKLIAVYSGSRGGSRAADVLKSLFPVNNFDTAYRARSVFNPLLGINSPKACWFDEKKNRMHLGYKGKIKSSFEVWLEPQDAFMYSKLCENDTIALRYECYADNLRGCNEGTLIVQCHLS